MVSGTARLTIFLVVSVRTPGKKQEKRGSGTVEPRPRRLVLRKRRLLGRLFSSFLVITLTCLLLVTWFASTTFRGFYLKQTQKELENGAILLQDQLITMIVEGRMEAMADFIEKLKNRQGYRVTVVLANGEVAADSAFDPELMDDHGLRAEIVEAFQGRKGISRRFSDTLQKDMIYVALPLQHEGELLGVVRTAKPMAVVEPTIHSIYRKFAVAWLVTAILAAAIILALSKRINRSFEVFKADVQKFAEGKIPSNLSLHKPEEMEEFVELMKLMAARLDERTGTLLRHRREEEAILSSMAEAVLAVDLELRILKINRACGDLFQIDASNARGFKIQEVIRNVELNHFVEKTLSGRTRITGELSLYIPEPMYLEAHGTRLFDDGGNAIGAVVVLSNVTRLKRLENIRRDFVANVSHELRTPITSIKGFIETLQDGALEEPDTARRFLDIIARQADRLKNIIEDLLSLSKIEQSQGSNQLELQALNLREALESAIRGCMERVGTTELDITLECKKRIRCQVHPNLFEQAVINLIDNAVKYSPSGSPILIRAFEAEENIKIEIIDHGRGIPTEHLARLFERFYRVDKARSRDMGGTGLGLAIVKHIIQAHNGTIEVESQIDVGTTFTIVLPSVTVHDAMVIGV